MKKQTALRKRSVERHGFRPVTALTARRLEIQTVDEVSEATVSVFL